MPKLHGVDEMSSHAARTVSRGCKVSLRIIYVRRGKLVQFAAA